MRIIIILLLLVIVSKNLGYKVLVISPRFGRSHVTFAGSIADALTEGGHRVVVLLFDLNPYVKTNGTKLAKTILIPAHESAKEFYKTSNRFSDIWTSNYNSLLSRYEDMNKIGILFAKTCSHVSGQHHILDALKRVQFDLAVAEIFDVCAFGLIEYLGIPAHVAITSSILLDSHATILGLPRHLSYVPSTFSSSHDNMNILERMWNLIDSRITMMSHEAVAVREQKIFRKLYGKQFIKLNEKIAQSAFVLVNSDPLYDFPRITFSKIIHVGGINVKAPRPLSEEWESVLQKRPKAVIIAFGSVVKSSTMPQNMKKAILKALAQFPNVTFIWKYEKKEHIAKDYSNVVVADWIPQNDLLNHERIVGAITHGGINGIHEAVYAGKPLIVVPLFAEQTRNARMVERANLGILLPKNYLFYEKECVKALSLLLNNSNYSLTAQRLSKMVKRRPQDVKKTIVKHLEFAAEFGNLPMLDNPGRKQSIFVFYFLDILLVIITVYIAVIGGVLYLLRSFIFEIVSFEIKFKSFETKDRSKIGKVKKS